MNYYKIKFIFEEFPNSVLTVNNTAENEDEAVEKFRKAYPRYEDCKVTEVVTLFSQEYQFAHK